MSTAPAPDGLPPLQADRCIAVAARIFYSAGAVVRCEAADAAVCAVLVAAAGAACRGVVGV
jgi:hypothetical protein